MPTGSRTVDCLILGAGISGLAAGRALQAAGRDYAVLEAGSAPGGLTRTVSVDRFHFDCAGHLLHLARHETPSRLPYCGLDDNDWLRVNRNSFCYLEGRLIPAPVQYHLASLPSPWREDCVKSFRERPPLSEVEDPSFREFIIRGFGQVLAESVLIPLNEKTYAISLDRLSSSALTRFFPLPDEARIQSGISGALPAAAGTYNSQFWYPRSGGIQKLVDGLARGQESRIHILRKAAAVDLEAKTLSTDDGDIWKWNRLLTSIPLKDFCRITNYDRLRDLGAELSHSATVVFNLGLKTPPPAPLKRAHWVYVPDREISFYRLGIYSNFGAVRRRPLPAALYIEVGLAGDRLPEADIWGDVFPRVLADLEKLDWVRRRDIACALCLPIPCSYVHFTPDRRNILGEIKARLRTARVSLLGRYGTWDYCSMEDSILSGIQVAESLP